MLRRLVLFVALCGCASESSNDDTLLTTACTTGNNCSTTLGASETTASGSESTVSAASEDATADGSGGSSGSAESGSSGLVSSEGESSSGPALDCTAPTDCDTCWQCAIVGACMGAYDGCASQLHCSPTLACVADNCPEQGVSQECVDMCCFSCQMLGTCGGVNGAIACVAQQCAGLCGTASC